MSDQIAEDLQAIRAQLDIMEQRTQAKLARIEGLLWLILSAGIFLLASVLGPGAAVFLLAGTFVVMIFVSMANSPAVAAARKANRIPRLPER